MHVVLFDNDRWREQTYPLSFTRPVSNLLVGILTINEIWGKWLNAPVSYLTADYLREKFPLSLDCSEVVLIRGNLLPEPALVESILHLNSGEVLLAKEGFLALRTDASVLAHFS